MVILYLLGFMGLIAIIATIVYLCTHDYTKDPKTGEGIEEKINDHLLKP